MRVGPHYAPRYYEAARAPGSVCYVASYSSDDRYGVVCHQMAVQDAATRIVVARAFRLTRDSTQSVAVRLADGEMLYAMAPTAEAAAAHIAEAIRVAFGYRLVNLREDVELQQVPTLHLFDHP